MRVTTHITPVAVLFGAAAVLSGLAPAQGSHAEGIPARPSHVPAAPVFESAQSLDISLPSDSDTAVLAVRTGPLPNGAELVLETADGTRIGSISVFGQGTAPVAATDDIRTGQSATPDLVHLVPVTLPTARNQAGTRTVTLSARLVLGDIDRPATSDEFRGATLVTVQP